MDDTFDTEKNNAEDAVDDADSSLLACGGSLNAAWSFVDFS